MRSYLEPEEIALLEQSCPNSRDRLLIHLLFHLGCRVTEALSIKVEDIDFTQKTITILHLKHRIKLSCPACGARLGSAHVFCPKCGNKIEKKNYQNQENRKQRILPIDADTIYLLKDFVEKDGPIEKDGKRFLFGINRHRA